jgi:hypothetical protein
MKRKIAAGAFILAVAAGVGVNIARHPETSTTLQDVGLVDHSERAQPGPTNDLLAGIRIRLSPSDFDAAVASTDHQLVPQVVLVATE